MGKSLETVRQALRRIDASPTIRERRLNQTPLKYADHKKRTVIALGIGVVHSLAAAHHPIATAGLVVGFSAGLYELLRMVKKQPK